MRNMRYGQHGNGNLLDLYVPPRTGASVPLVIWIHGGGWESQSKEAWPAIFLVDKGFAVASINYRLSGEAKFPAQIHDAKAAVRWLRANGKEYHLNPDRFGAWGASAGGHLAALLGTSGDVKEMEGSVGRHLATSSRVQAVADWFGATDMVQLSEFRATNPDLPADYPKHAVTKLLGGPAERMRDLAGTANPITFVTEKAPPFLIMHGERDTLVPLKQSQMLEEALKKVGAKVEFQVVPGADHGLFSDTATLREVEKFFNRTLRTADERKHEIAAEDAKLVATYSHRAANRAAKPIEFYSNGRLMSPEGINTWVLRGNNLVLCWYDQRSPTGVWVDTCTLEKDGKSYHGQNQQGDQIRGAHSGGGDLRKAADAIRQTSMSIRQLPLDAALSRATGARWDQVGDGYSIAISGATMKEQKDAISRFTAIVDRETGGTDGLSSTEDSISIDKALAQKIVDRFATLKAQATPGHSAADFRRQFSGIRAPLGHRNTDLAKRDAERLADLAKGVAGLDKPEVRPTGLEAVLVFKDQQQADQFSDMLVEARKRAGLGKETLPFYVPQYRKTVRIKDADLNSLSGEEATVFFSKAAEVFKEEKNKGKGQSTKTTAAEAPGFIRNLQAFVDHIEQMFGGPKQKQPGAVPEEGAQLPSPRFVAANPRTSDKGSPII